MPACAAAAAPATPPGASGASCPWATTRRAVKYVVCNGDEMEPGSFKDRFLIEGNPHLLIEGMAVACYAIQARTGYIFVRAQYDRPYAAAGSGHRRGPRDGLPGRAHPGHATSASTSTST